MYQQFAAKVRQSFVAGCATGEAGTAPEVMEGPQARPLSQRRWLRKNQLTPPRNGNNAFPKAAVLVFMWGPSE